MKLKTLGCARRKGLLRSREFGVKVCSLFVSFACMIFGSSFPSFTSKFEEIVIRVANLEKR